jgi:hypothetical protein
VGAEVGGGGFGSSRPQRLGDYLSQFVHRATGCCVASLLAFVGIGTIDSRSARPISRPRPESEWKSSQKRTAVWSSGPSELALALASFGSGIVLVKLSQKTGRSRVARPSGD